MKFTQFWRFQELRSLWFFHPTCCWEENLTEALWCKHATQQVVREILPRIPDNEIDMQKLATVFYSLARKISCQALYLMVFGTAPLARAGIVQRYIDRPQGTIIAPWVSCWKHQRNDCGWKWMKWFMNGIINGSFLWWYHFNGWKQFLWTIDDTIASATPDLIPLPEVVHQWIQVRSAALCCGSLNPNEYNLG